MPPAPDKLSKKIWLRTPLFVICYDLLGCGICGSWQYYVLLQLELPTLLTIIENQIETDTKLMNVTLTNNEGGNARLTVSVEENDYKDKVTEELKKLRRERTFPGFRKGTVSLDHVRRIFGQDLTSEVINREVYEAVTKYIADNKLDVLGQPIPVEVKPLDLKNHKDFTFEYYIALAPEMNLQVNKEMTMPYYEIKVSDEMIDEQDKAFRKRFGAQVPGEEFEPDALVKGVMMELNEDGTIKEGEDAIQVTNGIVAPMYFKSKEEADKFVGKKPGDKVVFNPWNTCEGNPAELSSMLNIDKEKTADMHSNFELAISEIIVVKPAELGEELYKQIFGDEKEVTNEEQYREEIKKMIANELNNNSQAIFRIDFRKKLMEQFANVELPAETLKRWLLTIDKEQTPETIDEYYEKVKSDILSEVIQSKLHEMFEVKVEDDDMLNAARMRAAQQFAAYGMTNIDDEVITNYAKQMLSDQKFARNLYGRLIEFKLYQAIEDAITLDKKEVTLDEFKEIASKA